jgi:hypothetical protein
VGQSCGRAPRSGSKPAFRGFSIESNVTNNPERSRLLNSPRLPVLRSPAVSVSHVKADALGCLSKEVTMASSGLAIQNRSIFRKAFEISVRSINGSMRPQGAFAGATGVHRMRVSLETVVQYASRYVYVNSGSGAVPSTRFARDWKEILRWEVDRFWAVDLSGADPKIETLFQAKKSFSQEHGQRSGEHLAYGFALAFIDRLLNIHPQRVLFFAASGARADFHLPIILPDGSRAGLEARSRGYVREPKAEDITAIKAKKAPAKGAVAHPGRGLVVYFLHGAKITKSKGYGPQNQTQLFLVDPVGDAGAYSDLETQVTAVRNYLQLTERIGLHVYTQILQSALKSHKENGELRAQPQPYEPDFGRPSPTHPIRREFGGRMFVGRFFSSLVAEGITPEQARARMAGGDYGTYSFEGLAIDVLRLIALHDWAGLAAYSHYGNERPEATDALEDVRAVVFGDGFCADDLELDESHAREVHDVKVSFGLE